MENSIINLSLYVLTFIFYVIVRRKIDLGFVLIFLYTMTAVMCSLYLIGNESNWVLSLWSFIYLYVIIMLFIRPFFFDFQIVSSKIQINNIIFLKYFIWFYVLCSFIDVYYGFLSAKENLLNSQWDELRRELYAGDIKLYNNQFERIARIIVQYFKPLAILVFFISLYSKITSRFWVLLFFISIVITSFSLAVNTASRGLLVALAASFICGYILFKNKLSKSAKRFVYTSGAVSFAIILIYSISVTNARFGDGNESSSLLYYFGHSMLVFNYGITDSIQTFGNGAFFFDWFNKLLELDLINIERLGTHFGTQFFTFVGSLYIDFGPNGTFLIAIIIPFFFIQILKRKVIGLAELFIVFVYVNYLFMGVFVIGRGNFLAWLIAIFIYKFLKFKKV